MIHVTGTLTCEREEDATLVVALLPEHIRLSRAEPGCLTFNVDRIGSLQWQLDESFVDQPALDAHQTRTRASDWFTATAHLARDFKVTVAP